MGRGAGVQDHQELQDHARGGWWWSWGWWQGRRPVWWAASTQGVGEVGVVAGGVGAGDEEVAA